VKYKNGFGDKSGTEVYKGGEVTYFGFVSFGGKRYQGDYGDGEFTQTTGTVTIGVPFRSVRYENDIMPWTDGPLGFMDNAGLGLVPSFDRGDRFRSAGMEINLFGLSAGFQLFTGDPGLIEQNREREEPYLTATKGVYKTNKFGDNPDKYREGIAFFGIGPFRFGTNNEQNRTKIQNEFAHEQKGVPWFRILEIPNKRYFYFGTGGGLGVY
jgi:hypothetical protein